jgi:hypothetical protein
MLDVRRLRVLAEVAARGSFTAAADALQLTQSAVTSAWYHGPAVSSMLDSLRAAAETLAIAASGATPADKACAASMSADIGATVLATSSSAIARSSSRGRESLRRRVVGNQ